MIKLTLHAQRSDAPFEVYKRGETLVINKEAFDFSKVPEGGILPVTAIASDMIAGPVTRKNGVLNIELLLPHPAEAGENWRRPKTILQRIDGKIIKPRIGA